MGRRKRELADPGLRTPTAATLSTEFIPVKTSAHSLRVTKKKRLEMIFGKTE